MAIIEPDRLSDQVYKALKTGFSQLIRENENQRFYAFALWTDDSLQFLHPVANTEEALTATVKRYRETTDPGITSAEMRWDYGDWGFSPADVAVKEFQEINEALYARFDSVVRAHLDEEEDYSAEIAELEVLWPAVMKGFQRLDEEGFFGSGAERSKITLLLVGDLSDEFVDSWVLALNPPELAHRFIHEF